MRLLPTWIKEYKAMPKRQRKHELHLTLWRMPIIYILGTFIIAAITLYLDLGLNLPKYTDSFSFSFNTTQLLISALIGGVLTLAAFTLNSLLVVLTTFSGQFSPRMLQDFVADKTTQHILGIFHGGFVYVLVIFLFVSNSSKEEFTAVPAAVALIAFAAALTFVFFINHATVWMQVHNITFNMKNISKQIISTTLKNELEEYRMMEATDLMKEYQQEQKSVSVRTSGYIQLIDYQRMIAEAKKDKVIIEIKVRVGSFTVTGNPLFNYWGPGAQNIDEDKYVQMFVIGHKETEIQDIKSGINKLSEIGIRALSNNDPRTTKNAIHQLTDLLLTVDQYITFTPYLADKQEKIRVITGKESFDFYLYHAFGIIRHYAGNNFTITLEIIYCLSMLAHSIEPSKHAVIWKFAKETVEGVSNHLIYSADQTLLLQLLYELADTTGNELDYYPVEKVITKKQT